ncbi:MAG: ABC transporter permease subunit, partial [Halobacteriales archaeon]|nr:ABC transporter permease subunit [Halobacteriales archaeon]
YFAYAAASAIAGEIDDESIELLLAGPISRTRVTIGKYLALVPSMVVLNAILYFGTALGVDLIGEHINLVDLALLHLLSIPYLLACAGMGLVASVRLDSVRRAQTVGAGAVFGMFIVDAVTIDTDYEWLGDLAFSRYYSTADILVDTDIVWSDTAVLIVAAVVLVVVSAELFERRDI